MAAVEFLEHDGNRLAARSKTGPPWIRSGMLENLRADPFRQGMDQRSREARDALEGGESSQAVGPQTRALDQLQQGMRDMADRFMEAMGANAPPGMSQVGAQPGTGRYPLGRQQGHSGFEALEGVRIPEEMELRRAREILDELRRRSGEGTRPPVELDYIDRLLKQF